MDEGEKRKGEKKGGGGGEREGGEGRGGGEGRKVRRDGRSGCVINEKLSG